MRFSAPPTAGRFLSPRVLLADEHQVLLAHDRSLRGLVAAALAEMEADAALVLIGLPLLAVWFAMGIFPATASRDLDQLGRANPFVVGHERSVERARGRDNDLIGRIFMQFRSNL